MALCCCHIGHAVSPGPSCSCFSLFSFFFFSFGQTLRSCRRRQIRRPYCRRLARALQAAAPRHCRELRLPAHRPSPDGYLSTVARRQPSDVFMGLGLVQSCSLLFSLSLSLSLLLILCGICARREREREREREESVRGEDDGMMECVTMMMPK